jgi:hypothetical protein
MAIQLGFAKFSATWCLCALSYLVVTLFVVPGPYCARSRTESNSLLPGRCQCEFGQSRKCANAGLLAHAHLSMNILCTARFSQLFAGLPSDHECFERRPCWYLQTVDSCGCEMRMIATDLLIFRSAELPTVLVLIDVQDTGEGMSAEALKLLFQPYSQASLSTVREHGGTGLGLSIVKGLLDLMHGQVDVTSEIGKGSDFHVQIPFFSRPRGEVHQDSALGLSWVGTILEESASISPVCADATTSCATKQSVW